MNPAPVLHVSTIPSPVRIVSTPYTNPLLIQRLCQSVGRLADQQEPKVLALRRDRFKYSLPQDAEGVFPPQAVLLQGIADSDPDYSVQTPDPDSTESTSSLAATLFQHYRAGKHNAEINEEIRHWIVIWRWNQFLSAQLQKDSSQFQKFWLAFRELPEPLREEYFVIAHARLLDLHARSISSSVATGGRATGYRKKPSAGCLGPVPEKPRGQWRPDRIPDAK
jgi:hypothetical protein